MSSCIIWIIWTLNHHLSRCNFLMLSLENLKKSLRAPNLPITSVDTYPLSCKWLSLFKFSQLFWLYSSVLLQYLSDNNIAMYLLFLCLHLTKNKIYVFQGQSTWCQESVSLDVFGCSRHFVCGKIQVLAEVWVSELRKLI